eukprot:gnl/TRDRNA2_/TRDRNA2_153157_c1_seq2.p1 gnl/TRDRNA2_/TRDRNA2_153157_c1~~gnl/TRDRNA2_/TRDRNA2_153157_c1_seq2.p1  ORF type:complete len:402 (+),score=30.37 gnl/TRDRNA2_/TRDRNA2_153157_c1_seq2:84-1208(+)
MPFAIVLVGLPVAIYRTSIGIIKGSLLSPFVSVAIGLWCFLVSLVHTPVIFLRSVRALFSGSACKAMCALILLPIRAPVWCFGGLVLGIASSFGLLFAQTLLINGIHPCKVLYSGILDDPDQDSTGLCTWTYRICKDVWVYHKEWVVARADRQITDSSPHLDANLQPTAVGRSNDEESVPGIEVERLRQPQRASMLPPTVLQLVGKVCLEELWALFFKRCVCIGQKLHADSTITTTDLENLEPFLFLGIPAVACVQILQGSQSIEGFLFETDVILTNENRPHNPFVDSVWHLACSAKKAFKAAQPLSTQELGFLESAALGRPNGSESFSIEDGRRVQLNGLVAEAVRLATISSRQQMFKHNFSAALNDILKGQE